MLGLLGRLLCLAFAAVALAVPASAISLMPGIELESLSGNLRFENFVIYTEGDISLADVADLDIEPTLNGIRIDGPLSLTDGEEGAIQIIYEVTVLGDDAVNGVDLFADTSILPGGFPTLAKTDKLIFEDRVGEILGDNELLAELATRNFAGADLDRDSADFEPQRVFTVLDTIRLNSGGSGGEARLDSLRNEFRFVPEPTTLLLLSGGLLGLAALGTRRARA